MTAIKLDYNEIHKAIRFYVEQEYGVYVTATKLSFGGIKPDKDQIVATVEIKKE